MAQARLGRSSPCRVRGTLNIPKEEKESENKMKTKMTAMFLTLVLALGLFGFAVAYWTDELTIEGTVTTGTFGWEWTLDCFTVTDDYKEIITFDVFLSDEEHPHTMTVEALDVYPCTDLEIWFDLHFWGSVPGIITNIYAEGTLDGEPLADVPDWISIDCEVTEASDRFMNLVGEWNIYELIEALKGTQWHECDYIDVFLHIHFVEDDQAGIDVPQGATLEFTVTVEGIQYNAID